MNRAVTFAFVALIAARATAAIAQEPAPASALPPGPLLTLEQAIENGLEFSKRLAELRARGEAARAAVEGFDAADRPVVSVEGGYTRTNHVTVFAVGTPGTGFQVIYPDVPDNFRTRLDLQWPIYSGGRPAALLQAATAEADATGKDLETARADLVLEITRAYLATLTAFEAERVVEQALARVEAQLADVRNQLTVGLVSPADVLSVEAQRSRQRMLLIEARAQRDVAAADLRRLTGMTPAAPFTLGLTLSDPIAPPDLAPSLVAEAQERRPEREAHQLRIEAAGARKQAAAAGRRPMVAVGAGYDYARPNPKIFPREARWQDSWDLGVNVRWSLWDGGRVAAEVAEASAREVAATERLNEFEEDLVTEVWQRRLTLISRLASIEAAEDGVRSASEARRVNVERFAAGVATSTELLDAQVVLLSAELDRTRAQAEARLAEAQLRRAIGR